MIDNLTGIKTTDTEQKEVVSNSKSLTTEKGTVNYIFYEIV